MRLIASAGLHGAISAATLALVTTPAASAIASACALAIGALVLPRVLRPYTARAVMRVGAAALVVRFAPLALAGISLGGTAVAGAALEVALAFAYRRRADGQWRTTALVALLGSAAGLRLRALGAYEDPVVHAEESRFQRIVVTEEGGDLRLFLDGHLQLSSVDEHAYHEGLVHPALAACASPKRVLLLGAGDGLAVREVLRDPHVESVTVVDIDPRMTALARRFPPLASLNRGALDDPRVRLVHRDAEAFLSGARETWDVILGDLPDPSCAELARLYSLESFALVRERLAPGGVVCTQATSPRMCGAAFWCVVETMREAGLHPVPYWVEVPAFVDTGFVIGRRESAVERVAIGSTAFAGALAPVAAGVTRRNDARLLALYYAGV